DQTLATTDAVDIGAKHDRADRTHHGAKPEHAIGIQERRGLVGGRKERGRNGLGVKSEQEEVELLEEIAAGGAQDGAYAGYEDGLFRGCGLRHGRAPRLDRDRFARPVFDMMGQSATPSRRDQRENAGVWTNRGAKWLALQG